MNNQGVRLINNLSERQVIRIWQYQLLDKTGLATEEGEPLEIIYPGRTNDDRGADFRDAVIAINGRLRKGDIEVHVKSSDWRAHRHHQDAVYNRVILHVVMWHDSGVAVNLENGGGVSVLALHKYIEIASRRWPELLSYPANLNVPCFGIAGRMTTDRLAEFLDRAGEERFLVKATGFRKEIAQIGAGQSLYRGTMGALGYSKNKLPFLELADRLPLQVLEMAADGEASDEDCLARLQALLLGTAGLLPSQRQDGNPGRLERLWYSYDCSETMSPGAWHLFKVRPNNSPIRRLVAMSYLVLRYRGKGLLDGLVGMVREVPLSQGCHTLEEGLVVMEHGYWRSRFDFVSGGRIKGSTLLGSRRAADIVVNVLLPFTFAWGEFASQLELAKKALELYHHYPTLAVNTIEKHMRAQLGLNRRLVNLARRQQGLLHIYKTRCTQGECKDCPLSSNPA